MSPRWVLSSATAKTLPPANVALRARPESCAKLKPSHLFDVEYPAGTYAGCDAGSNASS